MELAKLHLHWGACRRGKKEYKSYSLARAYREGGKNHKEIVFKIGKLSPPQVEQWHRALESVKNPLMNISAEDVTITSNRSYLDVAVILETWKSWGLSEIFDTASGKKRDIPLSSLVALMVANRCVQPKSKSQVATWVQKTALPQLLQIKMSVFNSSRIFRELSAIEACRENISAHLFRKIMKDSPDSMKSLFYDLSSTTFSGTHCILASWGHCKEGYEHHIVLALIVNTQGLPIYWEVLEGGTADATTISWLQERLKTKLPTLSPRPTMVFDRGMVSDENLKLLEDERIKYISAMDKNQIESIAKINYSKLAQLPKKSLLDHLRKDDFTSLDENTFCREISVAGERRYILCFNVQLYQDQRKAREEQIVKFMQFMNEQNQELCTAKINRSRRATAEKFDTYLRKAKLQDCIRIELDETYVPKQTKKMLRAILTYCVTAQVDEQKKLEAGRLDGFWLLVTNLSEQSEGAFTQDMKAVVQAYRDKVVIESSFRDIKSFIEISPVHVWRKEHVEAHYTICVLAHLIDRTLSLTLHEQRGQASNEIISHERLYEELSQCRLNCLEIGTSKLQAYKLTTPTTTQQDLLARLDMKHLVAAANLEKLSLGMNDASNITQGQD